MPASGNPNDEDEDDATSPTKLARVNVSLANVATIIIQNWNRHAIRAPMLAPLQLGGALHYRSNISSVLGALLQNRHAYSWTDDGKELRHPGFPDQVLRWQEPTAKCQMPKALFSTRPLFTVANRLAMGSESGMVSPRSLRSRRASRR